MGLGRAVRVCSPRVDFAAYFNAFSVHSVCLGSSWSFAIQLYVSDCGADEQMYGGAMTLGYAQYAVCFGRFFSRHLRFRFSFGRTVGFYLMGPTLTGYFI
ncbi:hypothetical protein U1Q18_041086 [Sarracenia purpurea var. burkii]